MIFHRSMIVCCLAAWICATGPLHAAVVVVNFNTEPFLDESAVIPLQGTASAGDLVQLVDAGVNGVPDTPNEFGFPGGDDALLDVLAGFTTTHVGANEPIPNWNLGIFNNTVTYDDGKIGAPTFLRFWNGETAPLSTHYGDTIVLNLPVAPPLGPAFLDYVPTPGSARITDTLFNATAAPVIPEAENIMLLGGLMLLFYMRNRRLFMRTDGSPSRSGT